MRMRTEVWVVEVGQTKTCSHCKHRVYSVATAFGRVRPTARSRAWGPLAHPPSRAAPWVSCPSKCPFACPARLVFHPRVVCGRSGPIFKLPEGLPGRGGDTPLLLFRDGHVGDAGDLICRLSVVVERRTAVLVPYRELLTP